MAQGGGEMIVRIREYLPEILFLGSVTLVFGQELWVLVMK